MESMECVSGERLAAALAMRRTELWDTNPRLAERIEIRIKDAPMLDPGTCAGPSRASSRGETLFRRVLGLFPRQPSFRACVN